MQWSDLLWPQYLFMMYRDFVHAIQMLAGDTYDEVRWRWQIIDNTSKWAISVLLAAIATFIVLYIGVKCRFKKPAVGIAPVEEPQLSPLPPREKTMPRLINERFNVLSADCVQNQLYWDSNLLNKLKIARGLAKTDRRECGRLTREVWDAVFNV